MEEVKNCPYCDEVILAIAKKCKHCGEWLPESGNIEPKTMITCPYCAEEIEEGNTICPVCKENLEEEKAVVQQTAPQKIEENTSHRRKDNKTMIIALTAVIIIILISAAAIFGLKYHKNISTAQNFDQPTNQPINQQNKNNVDDQLRQLVSNWNSVHLLDSVDEFIDLYDSKVWFYGTQLSNYDIYNKKLSALEKANNFWQEIVGNIKVTQINGNEYQCDFVKRVTENQKTINYLSYLIFRNVNSTWKITTESDDVTDSYILERKKNEICNFPKVKSIENLVCLTDEEPTNETPYYTIRIGQDMETHLETYYWFHIYKNPWLIMYYDVSTDSEMTIKQWQKENK